VLTPNFNPQKYHYRAAACQVEQILDMSERSQDRYGCDIPPELTHNSSTVAIPSVGSEEDPVGEADPWEMIYLAVYSMDDSANTLLCRQSCWQDSTPPVGLGPLYEGWCGKVGADVDEIILEGLRALHLARNGMCAHPASSTPTRRVEEGYMVPVRRASSETFLVGVPEVLGYWQAVTALWWKVLTVVYPKGIPAEQSNHLPSLGDCDPSASVLERLRLLIAGGGAGYEGVFAPIPVLTTTQVEEADYDIPALLKHFYSEVCNGGIGPGCGILGLVGGHKNDEGLDAASLLYAFDDGDADDPFWYWPNLLPFCDWGRGTYSCVYLSIESGQMIRFDPNVHLPGDSWIDAFSAEGLDLEEWLEQYVCGQSQGLWEMRWAGGMSLPQAIQEVLQAD